jgi:hypothetical protein
MPFTTKAGRDVVLAFGDHYLVVENKMFYFVPNQGANQAAFPSNHGEVGNELCSVAICTDQEACWKNHCDNQLAQYYRTQVIMPSVNRNFDYDTREKRTYLLRELQTTSPSGETLKCLVWAYYGVPMTSSTSRLRPP